MRRKEGGCGGEGEVDEVRWRGEWVVGGGLEMRRERGGVDERRKRSITNIVGRQSDCINKL